MNESFEAVVYKKGISICVAAITLQIFTIFSYITGTSMPSQAPPVDFFREHGLIWSLSKLIFGQGGLLYASE